MKGIQRYLNSKKYAIITPCLSIIFLLTPSNPYKLGRCRELLFLSLFLDNFKKQSRSAANLKFS